MKLGKEEADRILVLAEEIRAVGEITGKEKIQSILLSLWRTGRELGSRPLISNEVVEILFKEYHFEQFLQQSKNLKGFEWFIQSGLPHPRLVDVAKKGLLILWVKVRNLQDRDNSYNCVVGKTEGKKFPPDLVSDGYGSGVTTVYRDKNLHKHLLAEMQTLKKSDDFAQLFF